MLFSDVDVTANIICGVATKICEAYSCLLREYRLSVLTIKEARMNGLG